MQANRKKFLCWSAAVLLHGSFLLPFLMFNDKAPKNNDNKDHMPPATSLLTLNEQPKTSEQKPMVKPVSSASNNVQQIHMTDNPPNSSTLQNTLESQKVNPQTDTTIANEPEQTTHPKNNTQTRPKSKQTILNENAFILTCAYFPMLKLNEGERLYFYRCSAKKITVGYGSNIQANPHLLTGIPIFYCGSKLSEEERLNFIKTCSDKYKCQTLSKEELEKYTISRESAEIMAKKFMQTAINELRNLPQLPNFEQLPLPMKILAMDLYYNLGKDRFLKFKNFLKALRTNDYKRAQQEKTVLTNKEKGEINQWREDRKDVLCNILYSLLACPYQTAEQMFNLLKERAPNNILRYKEEAKACEIIIRLALQEAQRNTQQEVSTTSNTQVAVVGPVASSR